MIEQLKFGAMVFLGGGFGAVLRWSLAMAGQSMNLSLWYSTLLANILGTLFYFASLRVNGAPEFYQFFLRFGLFGALTTFSTLSYEVASAVKQGNYQQAILIFTLNILAGVLVAIGMFR